MSATICTNCGGFVTGKYYPDAIEAQNKTKETLDVLAEDDARECENKLVIIPECAFRPVVMLSHCTGDAA